MKMSLILITILVSGSVQASSQFKCSATLAGETEIKKSIPVKVSSYGESVFYEDVKFENRETTVNFNYDQKSGLSTLEAFGSRMVQAYVPAGGAIWIRFAGARENDFNIKCERAGKLVGALPTASDCKFNAVVGSDPITGKPTRSVPFTNEAKGFSAWEAFAYITKGGPEYPGVRTGDFELAMSNPEEEAEDTDLLGFGAYLPAGQAIGFKTSTHVSYRNRDVMQFEGRCVLK